MTLSNLVGSDNNSYSVIGNSLLAQTNRIVQLVTGKLPYDNDYSDITNGAVNYSLNTSPNTISMKSFYQQIDDIQSVNGAMDKAYKSLEQISTRIDIALELTDTVQSYDNLSNSQIDNINTQINFSLEEIDQIVQQTTYDNVPLLNGAIQKNGMYLNLSGSNSVDVTDAFNSASTQALGISQGGDVFITQDNATEFTSKLYSASYKVNSQLYRIEEYQNYLGQAFEEIKDTIRSSASSFDSMAIIPSLMARDNSTTSTKFLNSTISLIETNHSYNNSFYDRLFSLINA